MIGKCLHAVTGELLSKKTRMKKLNKTYGTYYFIFLKTSSNINTKKLSKKRYMPADINVGQKFVIQKYRNLSFQKYVSSCII